MEYDSSRGYVPSRIHHGEGFVSTTDTGWEYYYYKKDHVGNVRALFQGSGTSISGRQRTNYYPFGSVHGRYQNLQLNRHLFSGKELEDAALGPQGMVGWYDYGARMYNPRLGRWLGQDPMMRLYERISPYAYCLNSPVNYIDRWGLQPEEPPVAETVDIEGVEVIGHPVANIYLSTMLASALFRSPRLVFTAALIVGNISGPLGGGVFKTLAHYSTPGTPKFFNRMRSHYAHGNGETIVLTQEEFVFLVRNGILLENEIKQTGEEEFQSLMDFYSSSFDLRFAFGKGTVYFRKEGDRYIYTRFEDTYNFDPRAAGKRSFTDEWITRGYGYLFGGTPFNIVYP